ncbi:MAG: ATP synthase subunit I [Syntrophobacterales bacterium]|nr:ATP synthase subunit I [Syntrophobacterales bacterium]
MKTTLQKKIELVNWGILGVFFILSFIFLSYNFAFGVLLGGLISIINFYWLSRNLVKLFRRLSDKSKPGNLKRYLLFWYYIRLAVTGLVLYFVITQVPVSVIGLVFGLSIVIIGIVLTVIVENIKKKPLRRFEEKNASPVIFG